MRNIRSTIVFTVIVSFGGTTLSAQGNAGAAVSKQIPRTPQGKPDFNGFFDLPYVPNMAGTARPGGQGAAAEDGIPAGEADVPYTALGKSAYVNHDSKDDPTANCWLPGVPRIMQSPYPVQFVQTADHLAILFEYMHTFRSIPLNGRPHPRNMEPAFLGDSTGHWDGDDLIVDTAKLKGPPWTWLDTAGHQHSGDMHVIERFRRTADNIEYEYTVDDPAMYAKPWTLKRILRPLPPVAGLPELLEYSCTENNQDVRHLVPTKPALGLK